MDPDSERMRNETLKFKLGYVGEYSITFRVPFEYEAVDQSDIDELKFEFEDFKQLASFKHNDIVISIQYIELQKLDRDSTELIESLTREELSVLLELAYYRRSHKDLGNSDQLVEELCISGCQEAAIGSFRADSKKIINTIIIHDDYEEYFTDYDPSSMTSLDRANAHFST